MLGIYEFPSSLCNRNSIDNEHIAVSIIIAFRSCVIIMVDKLYNHVVAFLFCHVIMVSFYCSVAPLRF